jgi:hypothetical protein
MYYNNKLLVAWLVSDNLLLKHLRPYRIIFMNVFAVITVTMVMLLRNFGVYGIIL